MKKLLAILVVLTLVTGAVFAQPNMGGQLMIGANLATSNSDIDDIYMGPIGYHEAKIFATFGDDSGGGKLVYVASNKDGTAYGQDNLFDSSKYTAWGWLHWRPNELFRMQMGRNSDGDYGAAQISGWGFTGEAKNSVAAVSDYWGWGDATHFSFLYQSGSRRGSAFYPGTGDLLNVNFSLFPTHGMRINVVVPIDGQKEISDPISKSHINFNYMIEDAGTLRISFVGRGGLEKDMDKEKSIGDLYASFYLTSIEGIKLDLGLKYGLPYKNAADKDCEGYVAVGLGFIYDAAPFQVKFRTLAQFMGNDATGAELPTIINLGVLPNYRINNNMIFFFHAGFSMHMPSGDAKDTMGWYINPYIWLRAAEGLRFWTGLQIYQNGITDGAEPPVYWQIPFGFNFYF